MTSSIAPEWSVVLLLVLGESWLIVWASRSVSALSTLISKESEAIEISESRTKSEQTTEDKKKALHEALCDTPLESIWHSMLILARFPAPDLEPIWRAASAGYEAHVQRLRSLPNLALLAGLLATVGSLIWAFWDMGATLTQGSSATDPTKLAQDITPYLTRFRVAFMSTAIGVLVAIASSIWHGRTYARVGQHLRRLEAFLLNTCAPLAIPPSMEHSLDRIQVALVQANAQAEATARYMRGAALGIAKQVANMRDATARAIDSYQGISKEIQEGAVRLRENVVELGAVQRSIQDGYADLQRTLQDRHERLFAEQKETLKVFLDTAQKVQKLLVGHTNQTLQAFSTAGERFDQACDQFGAAAADFREMSTMIGFEAYNKMEEWSSRFHEALTEQEQNLEIIDARLLEVASAVRDMMERMSPQLLHSDDWAKVRAALENGAAAGDLYISLAQQTRAHLDEQREQLTEVCNVFLTTLLSVRKLPEAITRTSEELLDSISQHAEALNSTARHMVALGTFLERIEQSGDGVRRHRTVHRAVPISVGEAGPVAGPPPTTTPAQDAIPGNSVSGDSSPVSATREAAPDNAAELREAVEPQDA